MKNLINSIRFFFYILKGGEDMVVVYCTLIVAGKRTFASVPMTLKEKVKEALIAMDLSDLITE